MFVCGYCEETFEEPDYQHVQELHPELDGCPIEDLYFPICPYCGYDDFDEEE